LILPAVTLGAALAAILTRMVRGSMIEELSSDYVRTARAKGIAETSVLFRHAFPNALIPVITIIGLQFGSLLAGTIVTESIFPGRELDDSPFRRFPRAIIPCCRAAFL